MEAISQFLGQNKTHPVKISVVGDAMVDEYYQVQADNISPEFPIPILLSSHDEPGIIRPGGASNVCSQFRHFNADIRFFGFLDRYSESVLQTHDIDTQYSVHLPEGYHVPVKKRFYDKQFPLMRYDQEAAQYAIKDKDTLSNLQHMLCCQYESNKEADVTIFSNYNKGVFTNFESHWKSWITDGTTIVDPNSERPVECWAGCTILKPNDHEAKAITGSDNWKTQCDNLHKRTRCEAVVITQGGQGVVGSAGGQYFEYIPRHTATPESVIGAGDCFIAFLAMCVAQGMSVPTAAEVSYEAGAIYVNRKYNEPITTWDLLHKVDPVEAKIHASADELANRLQGNQCTKVITNGCFDILHTGHVSMLRYAKQQGDVLIVAVDSDENVARQKGDDRPINNLKDRMQLLACFDFIDFVVPFTGSPANVIEKLLPVEVLVKGGDWQADKLLGKDFVKKVALAPIIQDKSTTSIVNRIRA